MTRDDTLKSTLTEYLGNQHQALLWKLEGLSESDLRMPRTPTGTNLLGLVKHAASMEALYLGSVFARPFPDVMPWLAADAALNADMYAEADETPEWIRGFADRCWRHAIATIDALDLDAQGHVSWWGKDGVDVTLGHVLVHLGVEVARHAGHADIVREQIDGARGFLTFADNIPAQDDEAWTSYVARLQALADSAK